MTLLQESNAEGALNITREAKERSKDAKERTLMINSDLGSIMNSNHQRIATKKLMYHSKPQFNSMQNSSETIIKDMYFTFELVKKIIPFLNKQVR
jgi:hypothetical protein